VTESTVTLPPDPRRNMSTVYGPPCPKSKAIEVLARITLVPYGFEIRSFKCPECGRIHQSGTSLVDPMKCIKTAGWLRGELRAPT